MDKFKFNPTQQQVSVIEHEGSAFVMACPGAGKTRCIIERARQSLKGETEGRGIAFLSFTKSAISELEDRLLIDGTLPVPLLPHFVGTFDSFIWNFMVQPFGLICCDQPVRLIPDTNERIIKPDFNGAHSLTLKCFDRDTGAIDSELALKEGFDTTYRNAATHETLARNTRFKQLRAGHLDFEDARFVANKYLENEWFSNKLGSVLSARFKEIIVDEAQDCNPKDLAIVEWLQTKAGIQTKVVCDPNQSIYEFRGGVSGELLDFRDRVAINTLPITGNWRSTSNICNAISTLRAPSERDGADTALGMYRAINIPIYILSYGGTAVPSGIGEMFSQLIETHELASDDCRIIAATKASGAKAARLHTTKLGNHLSLKLADAVMAFHGSQTTADLLKAVETGHRVVLKLEGNLEKRTYHQAIHETELDVGEWRPGIIQMLQGLKLDSSAGETSDQWIQRARDYLQPKLPIGRGTIAQKLQNKRTELTAILVEHSAATVPSRTIHAVKGKEFPGVCVVMTVRTANGILTYLETEPDETYAEEARKVYVGASRAQKLLVFACPRSRVARLETLLTHFGAAVEIRDVPI